MEKSRTPDYNDLVLIPTDFSEVCDNAIHHGTELAASLGFTVCILHVINRQSRSDLKKLNQDSRYIQEKLEEIRNRYQRDNVRIETLAREGSIFEVINEVAAEKKARLMVMGTHGKKGLQYLFGSYALKVVLDSPCPVIVIQNRSFGEGYHKIVFPVTNDLEVRLKVAWAVLIASLFKSKIFLYQANEKDPDQNNRMKIITGQITRIFDQKGIPYEIHVAEKKNDFAGQVLGFARENQCDMIMVMTVPQVDVPGFSITNWDESMMFNESEIPVMCINPLFLSNFYYEWITLY